MTARDLINELLDCKLDEEIGLYINEPHIDNYGHECVGYWFGIVKVDKDRNLIEFKDWRNEG